LSGLQRIVLLHIAVVVVVVAVRMLWLLVKASEARC